MKVCPKCGAQYEDEMSFCLQDGTPLNDGNAAVLEEAKTEAFPVPHETAERQSDIKTAEWREAQVSEETLVNPIDKAKASFAGQAGTESKSSGSVFFLGFLAALGFVLIGGAIGGGVWYFSGKSGDSARISNQNTALPQENSNLGTPDISNTPDVSPADQAASDQAVNETAEQGSLPEASPSESAEKTKTPTLTPTPKTDPTPKPTADREVDAPPEVVPTPKRATPKTISAGVLNGKAISLPKPEYPAAARAVRANGAVSVQVLVDENGNVSGARAISGHPLLRGAAESAAARAKFSPTQLAGQPVKVRGVLTYVFK